MIDFEALFHPKRVWPEEAGYPPPIALTIGQEAIAQPPEASAISPPEADSLAMKTNLPEDSEERQKASEVSPEASGPTEAPASRFDLDRFPPEVRATLQEFEAGMKQDLLTISPVRCSWSDCQFPATVLIRTCQEKGGQRQNILVWGCPKCGRVYQPKIVSANAMDALENRGQRGPQPSASKTLCPCGSTRYVDTPIHGGKSIRRNCLQCGKFLGFPVWYGQRQEDLRPDPIPADGIRSLLDRAAALGWPELELSPWDVVGPGETRWRAFAKYLSEPQPTPQAETERLRARQLALLRIAERDAVTSNVEKGPCDHRTPGFHDQNMPKIARKRR